MIPRFLKNKNILFFTTLLAVFLFFFFSLYNIDRSNRYVDSLLESNYYKGAELNNYLTERINNELESLIKEKVENDELSAIISFNKSASRSELWVIVFGAISVVFLVLIGLLIWVSNQQRIKSEKIVDDLEKMKKEAISISTSAKEAGEEIKKLRVASRRHFISQIQYEERAERFMKNR